MSPPRFPSRFRSRFLSSSLLLALTTAGFTAHAGVDILACGTKEKEAVTPADPLNCHSKDGTLDSTLAELYEQNWRLIDAEFFNGDRAVLYLERETAP